MSSTPMVSQFDLLREKRQELNLPDPAEASIQVRRLLVKGVVIGAAMVGVSLGVAVLVFWRAWMVSSATEGLGTVKAEVQLFETQLNASRTKLQEALKDNQDLVKGLLAVRSGSAVLRDLQMRVPEGIQLTSAAEEGTGYLLKGLSRDPQAFARINALQLQLKRSPLLDPNAITLVKASREPATADTPQAQSVVAPVNFEIQVNFRPKISPLAEKQILTQLGSEGLVRRLDLLQKEGLL
ncbi:MAG: PilN domain-containing protein [Cyanobium sp. LacPavin_0920_WC12_MAG_63_22]|nr:PilN domain-containing protein [Cyanobium sp. LacPavin_0920_WC12_MAG_63_22]